MKKMLLVCATMLALVSCKKDKIENPHDEHEHDAITTVKLNFKDSASNEFNFYFRDLDGAGGNAPQIDTIVLSANTNYQLAVLFLHESTSEQEDLTSEIREEAAHHLICSSISTSNFGIQMTDAIGLLNQVTVLNSSTGTFRLRLKHYHDSAEKAGGCEVGETDVDVTFPIKIN